MASEHEKDELEDDDDDVPASPKTYFSSPASSTSSSFNLGSGSRNPRFSPPGSPLFAQQPDLFEPQLTGTQPAPAGLGRKGTGSLGMFGYNSQLDVDGEVDEVTAMLERDVDSDNWYRETNSQHVA